MIYRNSLELNDKLDFAPDIIVTLKKKIAKVFLINYEFEVKGIFTVPILSYKMK